MALAKLLPFPGDHREEAVGLPQCPPPPPVSPLPEASCLDLNPCRAGRLTAGPWQCGPQGPLETHSCLAETRLFVDLEPLPGSLFLSSDRCPPGGISSRASAVQMTERATCGPRSCGCFLQTARGSHTT